ncbi:MAG: hypothetical protein ACO3NL_07585 [Phycisphaerales bacterium]
MSRLTAFASLGLSIVAFALPAMAAPPLSIRDVAPKSSAIVVGGDDLKAAWTRLQETPLWGLWSSEEMQAAIKPVLEELREASKEMATELGRPDDELSMPASFGLAIFTQMDEEIGFERPFVLGFVDWGDDAGSLEIVEAMFDQAEKDGGLQRTDLKGEVVRVVSLGDEDEEEMDDDFGDPFGMDPMSGLADFDNIYLMKNGSRHLLASDLVVLEDLLAAIDGKAVEPIGTTNDFKDTYGLLGDPDVYAMLLTSNLQKMLASGEAAFMLATAQPILSQVFGDIRAHAVGMSVDQGGAMVDQRLAMTVPGPKKGLLSLITMDTAVEPPPAMVPSDAIGYGRMNIRFDAIVPTLREIVAGLGEMEREQMEGMLMQFAPMMEQAFGAMEPTVRIYNSVRMPVDVDSMETLVAIPCTDLTRLEPLVAMMGPGMGLMRRDFQGQAIYSDEFSPMAIGLGQGHLFLGPAAAVEQSLRGVPADDEGLAGAAWAKAALEALGNERVVGFGMTDLVEQIRMQREMMKMLGGEMPGFGDMDLDLGDDSGLPSVDMGEIDFEKMLDPELWKRFTGPAVWDFTVGDRGFTTRSRMMAPAKE